MEVIWLLKKLKHDFNTVADFKKNDKVAFRAAYREFNKLYYEWNFFGKEFVATDGTKFRAVISKKNNYSEKKIDRRTP